MHHCCYSVKYCRKCFVFLMFSRSECRAGVITVLLVTTVYSVCFCQSLQSMTVFLSGSPEEVKRQQLLHRCLSLQSMTVVLSGSPEEVKRQQLLHHCQSLQSMSGSVWVSRGGEETTDITSLSVITVNEWFCLGLQRR